MPYYLTKVLPQLLMPVPLGLLLVALAVVFIVLGRRRPAVGILLAALGLIWASSSPPVASALVWTLQKQYPPVEIGSIPESDCIILLGGVLGESEVVGVDIELNDAVDRVYQAQRLYRFGKGRRLIVSAGNQPWALELEPEANLIRDLLVEWGVPAESIQVDTTSRNTRENALNSERLVRDAGCRSNLLVTSGWHMPRAMAAFEVLGVPVFPVSVDVKDVPGRSSLVLWLIPRADALSTTSQVLLEWMGVWVYRWRGWN